MTASMSSSIRSTTAQPKGAVEVRLLSRSNEVLATKRTDDTGHVQFEAGLARGEGALAPAMLIASDAKGDYAFLSLKAPAFDLTDRGVAGRAVPAGLDAFVYHRARRLSLRRDRARDGAAARRRRAWPRSACRSRSWSSGRTASNIAAPSCPTRASAAARCRCRWCRSAPTGTWRVRAFTDPKRPPVGEATFLVEDYVPDRLEFELASTAKGVSRTSAGRGHASTAAISTARRPPSSSSKAR